MVEDVIDPMSVPMAVTHFSSEVMRDNGDIHAADLCHDVRNWWKAEDEAGISAIDRIKMRFCLRDRLLRDVDFSKFPPPTKYVNGWPIQLWEVLIASIDSKSILYSLTKTGTYNTRAFSSMMGETFFSEVANQDKHGGHGTLTAAEFEHFMGSVIEQMHIRLDSNRSFAYRTSKTTAYNLVGAEDSMLESTTNQCRESLQPSQSILKTAHTINVIMRQKLKTSRYFYCKHGSVVSYKGKRGSHETKTKD
ncbi:hypothetical protein KUTeg_011317 [Tegillarca granosa]|uniref:Uncharacterized protein n=1 Tax=Tegillarca granosa TaxID=220873 RepID=A0ABQ9F3J8_TEGGR|nr:hypothetical protein KUTeg_011317 [Tegillarca granosa]